MPVFNRPRPHQLPIVGRPFANPADANKIQAMQDAAAQTQAMRPALADAQAQAAQQTAGLFGPISQALEQVYGPGAGMDMGAAFASPISPEMMNIAPPVQGMEEDGGRKGLHAGFREKESKLLDLLFGADRFQMSDNRAARRENRRDGSMDKEGRHDARMEMRQDRRDQRREAWDDLLGRTTR